MKKLKSTVVQYLSLQGHGVDGDKLEIPATLPGEEVVVYPWKRQKAWLKTIVTPSPLRITPKCSHFGDCGGCTFQHLSYKEQLKVKEGWIKTLFPETSVETILGATSAWEWRNKMDFTFSQDKAGHRFLGLIGRYGKVVSLEECHLCQPWFFQALTITRQWWDKTSIPAYSPRKNEGILRTLILRQGLGGQEKMVVLHIASDANEALKKKELMLFKEMMEKTFGSISLYLLVQQSIKGQKTQFYEMHLMGKESIQEQLLGLDFFISPQSFFQPNTAQAQVIYQKALDLLALQKDQIVFDLYCGTATLSILLSQMAGKVYGIEISPEAVLDAKENIKRLEIDNIEVLQGDVAHILKKGQLPTPDVITVDPPRIGLTEKGVEVIQSFCPKTILYISCNPITLKKDIKGFTQYEVKKIVPIDQFPQTYHVETLCLLTRRK